MSDRDRQLVEPRVIPFGDFLSVLNERDRLIELRAQAEEQLAAALDERDRLRGVVEVAERIASWPEEIRELLPELEATLDALSVGEPETGRKEEA